MAVLNTGVLTSGDDSRCHSSCLPEFTAWLTLHSCPSLYVCPYIHTGTYESHCYCKKKNLKRGRTKEKRKKGRKEGKERKKWVRAREMTQWLPVLPVQA